MLMRRSVVRLGFALVVVLVLGLPTADSAKAQTVRHHVDVSHFDVHWACPGPNPVEHVTTTARITVFRSNGVRVRQIEHWHWKGLVENRETGELLRDNGDWTVVLTYSPNGNRVTRLTTSGVVWRFTVPGDGIIVHQSGRLTRNGNGTDTFTSTFGAAADTSPLCAFV